ncbi:uncharacterized protein LOC127019388 [Gymnogyps californianus]|uniref:uncharacterized protein LOC127019388 n=1 Tax=Gymnogyps californianus TaxID=33616 RepID=UPI0021C8BA7E|nr:uncharacterized protein LOC127019388 [Gymnogyps californianus]
MVLVPVAALWALAPLLTRADQPPVTVTAAVGEDACLPCGTQPWGHLRGVTLTCTQQAGTHHPVPVLSHRLGWHPPLEPGWHPPEEPNSRFRGRVAFCAAGPGDAGVSLLLRNLSDPDFGNYSCYVTSAVTAAPQLLCSLVLQPAAVAEVPKNAEPDMIMVVCLLTAAFIAVAIGVLACCHWGRRCCRRGAQEAGAADGGGGGGAVALGDLKSLSA